jgi:hypothetical protein
MPLATGEYVTAARQVGAAEQVLDAVSALSTKELAAKGCRYVTAATRVGRSKQRSRCCWSRAVRCRRRNWRPRAKGGEYVAASRQVAEQRSSCWTRSACVVSAEELAAKYDRCVAASLRAGARVQFVAGSGQYFVARVDVVATRHTIFWLTWPVPLSASARWCGRPGPYLHLKQAGALASYIMQIRLEELLAKQQGEIQLLLLAQVAQGGVDPSGTTSGEGIGPADTTRGHRVLLLQSPSCCCKQEDGAATRRDWRSGADAS